MLWLGWKDTWDQMPYCGYAIGAVDRCLYVPIRSSLPRSFSNALVAAFKCAQATNSVALLKTSNNPY